MSPSSPLPGTVRAPFSAYGSRIPLPDSRAATHSRGRSAPRCLSLYAFLSFKEVFPVEVWVRIELGARMSSDLYIREFKKFVFLRLEYPFSVSLRLPILAHDPPATFVRVSASAPLPCHLPDVVTQVPECFFGHIVAVVVCPSSNDRIEGSDGRYDITCNTFMNNRS